MNHSRPLVVGIVNITPDSFSDGGLYFAPEKAIAHARSLAASGADVVELGAASSNPDAVPVSAAEELSRLTPVFAQLKQEDCPLAVDSTQPEVQRYALEQGVRYVNDIRGFPTPEMHPFLAASDCKLVVMHSITHGIQAERIANDPVAVYDSIRLFFQQRVAQLVSAGVHRERIILDPGMGFFLSSNPAASLAILARLREIRELFRLPVMISVSRKSFLRNFKPVADCDVGSRTLAAELFAAAQGVDLVRTHDARALAQALDTVRAISVAHALLEAPMAPYNL
jgi:dihydropteroate synthase type 2